MPNTTATGPQQAVRTRFAPSPTGFLHLGGARTALYSWAFARHFGGQFILRIEDTDVERSTPAAVQAILDGMHWLGLDYDEGPHYQMQRMALYTQHIQALLDQGLAYPCYCTVAELEQMREQQRQNGQKIAYDGTWRPEPGKTLPPIPAGVKPVIRFKNPRTGTVAWDDLVKGPIAIDNTELDDLIIARQDGTPTYNFCVVVDDLDMRITHVIRGDDHINNTPRQLNIMRALGADAPKYGHLPMILGDDGEKLSKRHGAVSVMEYHEQGFLPESMVNYLARLGWSHGDDELFTRTQLVAWFDGQHWSKSAAQFNPEKLQWVNAHHMRQAKPQALLADLAQRLGQIGINPSSPTAPALADVLTVVLERANTLVQLRDEAALFYREPQANPEAITPLLEPAVQAALASFVEGLKTGPLANPAINPATKPSEPPQAWTAETLSAHLKSTLAAHGLKMPKLAMPLRLMLTGQTQTPSIDKVMALLGPSTVLARLEPWTHPTPKGQA